MCIDNSKKLKFRHLKFLVSACLDGEVIEFFPEVEDAYDNIVYEAFHNSEERKKIHRVLYKIIQTIPEASEEEKQEEEWRPKKIDMPRVTMMVWVEDFSDRMTFDWDWSRDLYSSDHLFTEIMKCFSVMLRIAESAFIENAAALGAKSRP